MYVNNSSKYGVEAKTNQHEKNRCFLIPNCKYLPLAKIRITDTYVHITNRAVIICSKNGVRKSTRSIWGNNEVISIKKKIPQEFTNQARIGNNEFIQQQEVNQLLRRKLKLISERQTLINQISHYKMLGIRI